jgi:RNA polymerase sigma-70 factor (ECF subfamily)
MFEKCAPTLLKRCRRILHAEDGAEDAVHDTFVRAFESQAHFDGRNFPGWVLRIAERLCIDRLRARQLNCHEAPANGAESVDPNTKYAEVHFLTAAQIRAVLSQLPDPQRQCLKLFYIEGYSAKEVAAATGFTDKQVKSYLQNGRRNFVKLWKALQKNE